MTATKRWFCADAAAERGDSMLGTAFPAGRLVLVEQPGPWGRGGLLESGMDRGRARSLVERTAPLGVRVLAIRSPHRHPMSDRAARRMFLVDDGRIWSRPLDDATDTDTVPLTSARAGDDGWTAEDSPLFLVCAHGSHDACCAVRGRPVAAALAASVPGRVYECSHVGGDRFAANVVTLPDGLMYGRVTPGACDELVASVRDRRQLFPLLRGQIGLPAIEQVAVAAVRHQRGLDLGNTVRPSGVREMSAARRAVTVTSDAAVDTVMIRVDRTRPAALTCRASRPSAAYAYTIERIFAADEEDSA